MQDSLRSLVEGTPVGVVIEGGRRLPLIVRGPQTLDVADVQALRLPMDGGASVALSHQSVVALWQSVIRLTPRSR